MRYLWPIVAAYIAGFFFAWVVFAHAAMLGTRRKYPNLGGNFDLSDTLLSIIPALLWPLTLLGFLVYRIAQKWIEKES